MTTCYICGGPTSTFVRYAGVHIRYHVDCTNTHDIRGFDQLIEHYNNHINSTGPDNVRSRANDERNEHMSDIKQRKMHFASLPLMQALSAVKVGWELETQAVDGMEYDECRVEPEPEFNEERYNDDVASAVDRVMGYGLYTLLRRAKGQDTRNRHAGDVYMPDLLTDVQELYSALMASDRWRTEDVSPMNVRGRFYNWVRTNDPGVDTILVDYGVDTSTFMNAVNDYVHDTWDTSEYYETPDDEDEFYLPGLPNGVVGKYDGSVSGPEFVIDGNGTSVANAIALLRKLCNGFDLDVDAGCSFHVHVSVPGIKHSYGPNLQMHMYEYLLQNAHRVPQSVRDRWETDEAVSFFRPDLSTEKYSFVHFHRRCGTWEFRCFGNIDNAKDGARCIKLAVEALQYAYRVQLGLSKAVLKDSRDWNSTIYRAVLRDSGTSVAKEARKMRTQRRVRENEAA